MKRLFFLLLAVVLIFGVWCSQETRRGMGNEGLLIIQAVPDDAEVYVDGEQVGKAGKVSTIPPGIEQRDP